MKIFHTLKYEIWINQIFQLWINHIHFSILIFAISSRILCKISKQLFILFRPCLFFLWPFSFLTYLFDPNTCKGTNEKIISISWEKLSNLFYYRHIYMRWGLYVLVIVIHMIIHNQSETEQKIYVKRLHWVNIISRSLSFLANITF